jgi:hypothetical protein
MKYAIALAAVVATGAFAVSPASSMEMPCSSAHLSKMATMVGTMREGPHKLMMYKHLEMVNTAMAKDGMRGCEMTVRKMHRHHMHQMKHGNAM